VEKPFVGKWGMAMKQNSATVALDQLGGSEAEGGKCAIVRGEING